MLNSLSAWIARWRKRRHARWLRKHRVVFLSRQDGAVCPDYRDWSATFMKSLKP
jgi:hypothetical protein